MGSLIRYKSVIVVAILCTVVIQSGCSQSQKDKGQTQNQSVSLNIPAIPDFIASVESNNKKLIIHYLTSFEHDDNNGCVAFNMALAGLAQGYEVEMFFDAAGVYDLKVESDGSPHSYGYKVPFKLKQIIAKLYPIEPDDMPITYRDYLYWLHKMGVEITYNGFIANLVSLQDNPLERNAQIEKIAIPLSLGEALSRRNSADAYLSY